MLSSSICFICPTSKGRQASSLPEISESLDGQTEVFKPADFYNTMKNKYLKYFHLKAFWIYMQIQANKIGPYLV